MLGIRDALASRRRFGNDHDEEVLSGADAKG